MLDFAQSIANIANKPITKDFGSFKSLLSFGYYWQAQDLEHLQDLGREIFILHPLFVDKHLCAEDLRYEIGTEFGVAWLLAYMLTPLLENTSSALKDVLKTLDIGYLASESNIAEEELEEISARLHMQSFGIVLGSELAAHLNASEIAQILGTLGKCEAVHFIMPELTDSITPQIIESSVRSQLTACEELPESNGHYVYMRPFSAHAAAQQDLPQAAQLPLLQCPPLFAPALKLQDNKRVRLCFEGKQIEALCMRAPQLKGTIALLYLPQAQIKGYPYKQVEVKV